MLNLCLPLFAKLSSARRLHTAVHQLYTVRAGITATEAIRHGWPTCRRLHLCQNVHSCGSAKSSMVLQRQTPFGSGSEVCSRGHNSRGKPRLSINNLQNPYIIYKLAVDEKAQRC